MNSNISLKLHAFGIKLLHDPFWTGMELYDKLKSHVRHREEPGDMLRKTIKNGLLFHLGTWVFEEYLQNKERFESFLDIGYDYLLWYIEDYIAFLYDAGIEKNDKLLMAIERKIETFTKVYDENEESYQDLLTSENENLKKHCISLSIKFKSKLEELKEIYAKDFAERVFHDRILCEYISKVVILIGFDGGASEGEEPKKWIDRKKIPEWAKKAIRIRDGGKCSFCDKPVDQDMTETPHIDHIIPLSKAGTNDLCNLQLLCESHNRGKSNKDISVSSSVPRYLHEKTKK